MTTKNSTGGSEVRYAPCCLGTSRSRVFFLASNLISLLISMSGKWALAKHFYQAFVIKGVIQNKLCLTPGILEVVTLGMYSDLNVIVIKQAFTPGYLNWIRTSCALLHAARPALSPVLTKVLACFSGISSSIPVHKLEDQHC